MRILNPIVRGEEKREAGRHDSPDALPSPIFNFGAHFFVRTKGMDLYATRPIFRLSISTI
jgi:hypothetical protein